MLEQGQPIGRGSGARSWKVVILALAMGFACTALFASNFSISLTTLGGGLVNKDDLEDFKRMMLKRGSTSIKGVGRTFKIYDDDRSKTLSLEEFAKGVKDYGLESNEAGIKTLFDQFDADGDGLLSFGEFLASLRGQLNDSRLKVVKVAFSKADKNGDGVVNMQDLKRSMDPREHPKFKSGEWDEKQVFTEFLNRYEPDAATRDGTVTEEEFIKYYTGVSANLDSDAHFELLLRQAWKI